MTSEVTQAALEPCPFCGGKAEWKDDPGICGVPFCLVVDHKPDCFLAFPLSEEAMLAAWNTRLTAQSGEQQSCEPIAAVEMIETVTGDFYTEPGEPIWRVMVGEYCADLDSEQAARNFASAINLTAQSGEGRSGAGEDALREALAEHFPTGLRSGYARTAGGIPVQGGGIEADCRCGWSAKAADEHEVREEWAAHVLAALNARQSGEGEREADEDNRVIYWLGSDDEQRAARMKVCAERRSLWPLKDGEEDCPHDGSCHECTMDMASILRCTKEEYEAGERVLRASSEGERDQ